MNNLELLLKFDNIKEVAELIDDITTLRKYFYSEDYERMQEHIQKLMIKYCKETIYWNSVYTNQSQNFEQAILQKVCHGPNIHY